VIKYFEKLYVGVHNNYPGKKYPMGFATPFGTDAAFHKRKETVDGWARGGKISIIDNVPMSGFSIEASVSRYSTSNKLFRVADPRGFELEISAENLTNILSETVVDHGVIQGEAVWGRLGPNNVLTSATHPDYIRATSNAGPIKVEPGQTFINTQEQKYIFKGKYWLHFEWSTNHYHHHSWHYNAPRQAPTITKHNEKDPKPWFVYEKVDKKYGAPVELRRSKMPISRLETPEVSKTDLSKTLEVDMQNNYGRKARFFASANDLAKS